MSNPNELITMKVSSGDTPSLIHLPDGTVAKPNASGEFAIPAKHLGVLLAAGFMIITADPAGHVP